MDRESDKKVERESMVTVEDSGNMKISVRGCLKEFTVRKAIRKGKGRPPQIASSAVIGLDEDWEGKEVLCILLE